MTPIKAVVVVVPVRDEQERLNACLDSLEVTIDRLAKDLGPLKVRTVVALDRCRDASEQIARARPGVTTVALDAGCVGATRRRGVDVALTGIGVPRSAVWIATTDGDSRVPADWLTAHVEIARSGGEVFRGLVEPDPTECGLRRHRAWAASYLRRDGHPHIHGANFGIRADVYGVAGGFDADASCHEDVLLAGRAEQLGASVVASSRAIVTTSGRLTGRVRAQGFADALSAIEPA